MHNRKNIKIKKENHDKCSIYIYMYIVKNDKWYT